MTKNMATAAKVKGHATSINASVGQKGAVAEFVQSTRYNQADYQMDTPVSLGKVTSVTFSLEVTGTPDSVSFKLYDSDGKELNNITQYNKKSGTYTIEIPEEYRSKTISQFSIMTNTDIGEGVTQTATAVLTQFNVWPGGEYSDTGANTDETADAGANVHSNIGTNAYTGRKAVTATIHDRGWGGNDFKCGYIFDFGCLTGRSRLQ